MSLVSVALRQIDLELVLGALLALSTADKTDLARAANARSELDNRITASIHRLETRDRSDSESSEDPSVIHLRIRCPRGTRS